MVEGVCRGGGYGGAFRYFGTAGPVCKPALEGVAVPGGSGQTLRGAELCQR